MALVIYVDDMIITGNDLEEIALLQERLSIEFEMKKLGELKYFLDLLAEVGMLDCKPVDTPIVQNHRLADYPDQVQPNKERYQRLVGKLTYLSHTRPDLAYTVSVISQFKHAPSEDHMNAVERILRYLKGAPGRELWFRKGPNLEIVGYTDADWVGSLQDRRSTSGYFTFLGINLVTWRSKKQKMGELSSAEAEFRGMAKGLCELLWLKKLMCELWYPSKIEMKLFCDNKAAIDISHNPVQHNRTKHIKIN
ncbi:secreted RxLR effector protein 161-like [Gastrolobium bilobum]|uniref:secreted RxLR effector protein 161-like n=1 Tax=Gastrolobium bilobum TaxID=150636 RepID=UPI002AB129F8|nr:secreted RxLR effector protein 161-like [Gastrolobium bilobum]